MRSSQKALVGQHVPAMVETPWEMPQVEQAVRSCAEKDTWDTTSPVILIRYCVMSLLSRLELVSWKGWISTCIFTAVHGGCDGFEWIELNGVQSPQTKTRKTRALPELEPVSQSDA